MNSFQNTPVASVFIHWLNGMIYVFYFASFVILLREILRPGVLWFLRNLNDPDFNPIQVEKCRIIMLCLVKVNPGRTENYTGSLSFKNTNAIEY